MKARRWIVGALVAAGVVFAMRGCLSRPAPDERVADRMSDLCEIARDNVKTPEKGVRALGTYLGKHAGDLVGDFVDTIAMIERISDDEKHDARARVARDRLRAHQCGADWNDFADAVARDPEATALIDHASERLNRTFEILFGSKVELRDVPAQIDHLMTNL